MRTNEIKNEINDMKKWENKIKRKDLKSETNWYKFDFKQFETIRIFGVSIHNGKISIDESEIEQTNLLENVIDFKNKSISKSKKIKTKNKIILIV